MVIIVLQGCQCPQIMPDTQQNSTYSDSENSLQWYVMRVTYQRELIASRRLTELGVENFVPTRLFRSRGMGATSAVRIQRKALVHNYIFIRSDKATIDAIKSFELPYLRYVMHTVNNLRQPMVVPPEQMRSFILVTGTEDERLKLLDCSQADLRLGSKVRVVGGIFAGAEGVLVKVAGVRDRRVVVAIEGVAAVAMPKIEKELLEPIEI